MFIFMHYSMSLKVLTQLNDYLITLSTLKRCNLLLKNYVIVEHYLS